MNLLIVEDDRDYRALLYQTLHGLGHDVLAVSDAVYAVALLRESENSIQVVLLDLKMPRLGGNELMQTFAGWTDCKAYFIVMSGHFDPERYKDHPRVVGCLHKPFPKDELVKLLKEAQQRLTKEKTAKS